MVEDFIDHSKCKIVDDDICNDHKRKLARERKRKSRKSIERTAHQCEMDEMKAAKKEKKSIKNKNEKRRRNLTPTAKLVEQISFRSGQYVSSALSELLVSFRNDGGKTFQRTNAIHLINNGVLQQLYACIRKRFGSSSVVVVALELFSWLMTVDPFTVYGWDVKCTEQLPYKMWYSLLFDVIKQRGPTLNMAVKSLYLVLSDGFRSCYKGSDLVVACISTATLDEEAVILALLFSKLVDVGQALYIYSKIILYGPSIYREDACKVVCSIVDVSTVELSILIVAVDVMHQLLNNDENLKLVKGQVGTGVAERIKPYADYRFCAVAPSADRDKRLLMPSPNVVEVYKLLKM